MEPNVVTASTRTSLKSVSGTASGTQLAARHCFLLEDPTDEGKKTAEPLRYRSYHILLAGLYIVIIIIN